MPEPIAVTKQGEIKGIERFGSLNFRGVPYAVPPVGGNRWKQPVPAEPWDGVRDATEFGPVCPQNTTVLIDGARMASPGIVAGVLRGRRLHHRPVISTLGFHLGPDVQMKTVPLGYDQAEEDRLLDQIDWTRDGYRLFDISVFAGSSARGWFAPMWGAGAERARKGPAWPRKG